MRNVPVEKIESWWRQFAARKDDVVAWAKQQKRWDLADWMEAHLQGIHPALMWEFGPAVRCDGYRLVITPQSRRDLQPALQKILSRPLDCGRGARATAPGAIRLGSLRMGYLTLVPRAPHNS